MEVILKYQMLCRNQKILSKTWSYLRPWLISKFAFIKISHWRISPTNIPIFYKACTLAKSHLCTLKNLRINLNYLSEEADFSGTSLQIVFRERQQTNDFIALMKTKMKHNWCTLFRKIFSNCMSCYIVSNIIQHRETMAFLEPK